MSQNFINIKNDQLKLVDALFRELYPINRSLTGKGNEKTLQILSKVTPLDVRKVPSGSKVFDWTIPPEWCIRDAYVKNANGKKIIDWQACNLHVLNYSIPVNLKNVSKKELIPHLHTLPTKPDWIPYRTSYYERNWGFCANHALLESEDFCEPFEVYIDSGLNEDGELIYAEAIHRGVVEDEVLISSYFCHPSLANDNLSGVITAVMLFNEIRQCKTHYTYRLVLCPETIGAITFLASLQKPHNIIGGCVCTTTAGPGPIGIKRSFLGGHMIDELAIIAMPNDEAWIDYPFVPDGSDERQYSSPGFRIPTITICKSKYYEYEEYHTSADNLDFVRPEYLIESLAVYSRWIHNLEANRTYKRTIMEGEFQLGRRGLFPNIGGTLNQLVHSENSKGFDGREFDLRVKISGQHLDAYNWIMHMADGTNSILDISKRSEISFDVVKESCMIFKKEGLLEIVR